MSRDLFHRIGSIELAATKTETRVDAVERTVDDHEVRLRKEEHLSAKVVGAALMGSTVGAWILSKLGACVG
jgi:hypothetical protein